MKFAMPMVKDFVPKAVRPWLYVVMALCFQVSAARYLGALNEIIGATAQMREDVLMCLYCNLAGMALWFPMLFRMKFRFTNKTLLVAASLTVLVTNLLIGYVTWLPLLWLLCFIEGIAKIQGTFECMSNKQLWMTPKRDMTIFFPLLHIVILTSMNLQDFMSAYFGMLGDWRLMHWFVAGVHCVVLLFLLTCVRHFRFMRPLPLYGIDWTSMALWAALLVQVAYVLNYGDWYAWFNHDAVWYLTGSILISFALILHRMTHVRHPYINPRVFTGFRYVKQILVLVCFVECLFGTEHILEEIYLEEVMHYSTIVNATLCAPACVGCVCGCLFSLFWLQKVMRMSYIRLGIIGSCMLLVYMAMMYLLVSPAVSIEMLYLPLFCRGFAYTTLSIVFFLLVARRDGFQPLLPRAGCVQHAAHVGGRMPGVCRLCEDDRLVCGRRLFALYERCVVAPQLIRHWLAVDNRRDAPCRSEGGLWLGLLWMCVSDSRIPALRFADTQAQIVYVAMESGGQNGEEILQSCTALNVRFQFLA